MARKTKPSHQNEKEVFSEKENIEMLPDSPLLDLRDATVKKIIELAKKRGYVTSEQVNEALRSEEAASEQIENILTMLSHLGISTVEQQETETEEEKDAEEPEEEESDGGLV